MEALVLALLMLAAVLLSSVIDQLVPKVSSPLIQIGLGLLIALFAPSQINITLDPDLFLVLFIAPLLFDEAKNVDKGALWKNRRPVLSLAIGLVVVTALIIGFAVEWLEPSIGLFAAFALGAALGPTDAVAVASLSKETDIAPRDKSILEGESLINDASGVVAFQFASAAALTGAFLALDAAEEFGRLFLGGIAAGVVVGVVGLYSMRALRRGGYESTTINVLYEVFSPFFVYLFAEWLGTSGILAVVAAGLIMADRSQRLTSASIAQRQLVSRSFWRIIVFLINSVVFVLLGMQLPQAFTPAIADHFSLLFLLGVVALVTALIAGCRFGWVLVMEEVYRVGRRRSRRRTLRKKASKVETVETNQPSPTPHLRHRRPHWRERIGSLLKNALVLTVGGPKGAVTLSIIFTLPLTMPDGATPFPERDLIVFLTASVILCTLLLADGLLPLLSPRVAEASNEQELSRAAIRVLEGTLRELQAMLASDENTQYDPALRLTIAHYRVRLARARESVDDTCSQQIGALATQVREVQEKAADAIHEKGGYDNGTRAPYYAMLREVRRSLGYDGADVKVGSRFSTLRGRARLLWQRTKPPAVESDQDERVYYDTCLFAIELEHAAIDYLQDVVDQHDGRQGAAQLLLEEHRMVLNSLWNRINHGQDVKQQDRPDITLTHHQALPDGMQPLFGGQFAEAARYADEVDADALSIELDQIRHLQDHGEISLPVANELRQRVYVLQMSLGE